MDEFELPLMSSHNALCILAITAAGDKNFKRFLCDLERERAIDFYT